MRGSRDRRSWVSCIPSSPGMRRSRSMADGPCRSKASSAATPSPHDSIPTAGPFGGQQQDERLAKLVVILGQENADRLSVADPRRGELNEERPRPCAFVRTDAWPGPRHVVDRARGPAATGGGTASELHGGASSRCRSHAEGRCPMSSSYAAPSDRRRLSRDPTAKPRLRSAIRGPVQPVPRFSDLLGDSGGDQPPRRGRPLSAKCESRRICPAARPVMVLAASIAITPSTYPRGCARPTSSSEGEPLRRATASSVGPSTNSMTKYGASSCSPRVDLQHVRMRSHGPSRGLLAEAFSHVGAKKGLAEDRASIATRRSASRHSEEDDSHSHHSRGAQDSVDASITEPTARLVASPSAATTDGMGTRARPPARFGGRRQEPLEPIPASGPTSSIGAASVLAEKVRWLAQSGRRTQGSSAILSQPGRRGATNGPRRARRLSRVPRPYPASRYAGAERARPNLTREAETR